MHASSSIWSVLTVLLGLALAGGCRSGDGGTQSGAYTTCMPGAVQSCVGPGGCDGRQACDYQGSTWYSCECLDGSSGGTHSSPTAGDSCSSPGDLVCGSTTAGASAVLFCGLASVDGGLLLDGSADAEGGVSGGTPVWIDVFACPETQTCQALQGYTSIECGLPGSQFNVPYAIENAPCAAEQSAACTFDQTAVLLCQRGTWQLSKNCGTGVSRCDVVGPGTSGPSWTCPTSEPTYCVVCN